MPPAEKYLQPPGTHNGSKRPFFVRRVRPSVCRRFWAKKQKTIQAELQRVRMWRWCQNVRIVAHFLTTPVEKYLHSPGTACEKMSPFFG